ncbi:MAG: 3-dehydroquinate synthase [Armatimonadetes bacterium 13_1_40CM_3_65_7]|nr:MAG: 3-dehydroquinate synthase [Armatimonadetes bacterium 13_1_40CM_3_65_7]
MGTGKTAVGEMVASRLGRPFLDTDALIEGLAGRPIPQIFAEDGEAAFRRLEAQAVASAAAGGGSVIATGGGVVLSGANMDRLRQNGLIVALLADPQSILARVGGGGDRPLLGTDPEGNVRRLLNERAPFYQAADLIVETSALSVAAVADRVMAFVGARELEGRGGNPVDATLGADLQAPQRVRVDLGARGYDVWIGRGLIAAAAGYLDRYGIRGRVALITHPRIEALYGRGLAADLRGAGYEVVTLTVPPSESSKSLRMAARLYDALLDAGFDRSGAVLALGGGVAGDLGGFVAATFLRGIAWVPVPTTLLAQVDASIGGKTGINLRAKNQVGAVHQPALVLADIATLGSLPLRELRSGMAEVVKTGVIGDPELFQVVEQRARACLRRDPGLLAWIVGRCAAYKAAVVTGDEREAGQRMVLNYGHTVGHAIEAAVGYRGITHGEAVAVGMTLEARLSSRLGLCDDALLDRQTRMLASLGLPVRLASLARGRLPARERIVAAMTHDKKATGGRLRFVLPEALGRPVIRDDVPPALVEEVLGDG